MRTKFKPWTIPYLQQHNDIAISIDNFDDFVFKDCIYLEIGCGKGDFICQMALKFPNIQFIGVEKNITCAGISTKKIVDQKIKNAFSDVCVSEKLERNILNMTVNKQKQTYRRFKLSYVCFVAVVVCLLSVTYC